MARKRWNKEHKLAVEARNDRLRAQAEQLNKLIFGANSTYSEREKEQIAEGMNMRYLRSDSMAFEANRDERKSMVIVDKAANNPAA